MNRRIGFLAGISLASGLEESMSFRSRLNRTHLAAAVGALLAIGAGLLLHKFPIGSGLVQSSQDWLNVSKGQIRVGEAVIVYLDEASHEKLGQPYNSAWDRALHAKLIDRLTAAGV